MKTNQLLAVACAAVAGFCSPSIAAAKADSTAECELHVWPTENYLGVNTGLLSGFGIVGALADHAAHKDRVKTTKDYMAEYLGPDAQIAELNRIGIADTLKLPGYRVVVEAPTPFNEDVKKDPALKASVKVMNAKLKNGQRLSNSTAPCYAELVATNILYHKAMMYGSNLFGGWTFRDYGKSGGAPKVFVGAVKNPLESFPPKTAEAVEPAKAEVRDAYGKDFVEFVQKKVVGQSGLQTR